MGALIHAKREIDEVMAEIDDTQSMYQSVRNRAITEYADVFCCVLDSARRAGISLDEITNAMNAKLQINKTRQWKDNGDGSYSHIKL